MWVLATATPLGLLAYAQSARFTVLIGGQFARTNGLRTMVGEPALTVGLGVGDPVKKTRSAKSWSCATFTIDFICSCGPILPAERAALLLLRRSERGCGLGRAFGMEGGTHLGEPLACAVQAAGQIDRV